MEELLTKCNYYKGEDSCPLEIRDKSMFWEYEKMWVERKLTDSNFDEAEILEYKKHNLENFASNDGIAIGIKALLFSRYMHWSYIATADDFKTWYYEKYKTSSLDETDRDRNRDRIRNR